MKIYLSAVGIESIQNVLEQFDSNHPLKACFNYYDIEIIKIPFRKMSWDFLVNLGGDSERLLLREYTQYGRKDQKRRPKKRNIKETPKGKIFL
jgi:uncharacterized protein YheU (UPF0270 family)